MELIIFIGLQASGKSTFFKERFADTTGAVYGQLAGAFYGAASLPEMWVSKLVLPDVLERVARQLLACSLKLDTGAQRQAYAGSRAAADTVTPVPSPFQRHAPPTTGQP